jgi:hypothetical protein
MAPFSVSQGSSTVEISSTVSGFTQNSPYRYYFGDASATRSDSVTITFGDGASVRLTDFNEISSGSSSNKNVIGIPNTPRTGFENSFNIIGGSDAFATFDVYDAYSNLLLLDNYKPQNFSYFEPYARFGYTSGQLTIDAPRQGGFFGSASINTAGNVQLSPNPSSYVGGAAGTASGNQYVSGSSTAASWVFALTGAAPVPVCFAKGTLIIVPDGSWVQIQKLQIGDLVLTADGAKKIKWVPQRKYTKQVLSIFPQTLPVRIQAGALGEGMPSTDLLVSRKHGLVIEGVEIGAETLCNGANITHCKAEEFPDGLTYYHIEFEEQEVLMANGCSNSSFVSTGNRSEFDNVEEYRSRYGDPDQPSPRKLSPYMWSRDLRRIHKNTLLRFLRKDCVAV